MEKWLKRVAKPISPPAGDCENSSKNTGDLLNDESDTEFDFQMASTSSHDTKRRKVVRKYDPEYLKLGFTWNQDTTDPRPQCVICYEILANESMRPSKLTRHKETKHSHSINKPVEFFQKKIVGNGVFKIHCFSFH